MYHHECGDIYIREIKRPIEVRIKEHKTAKSRSKLAKSSLAKHALTEHHRNEWEYVQIFHKEHHWYKRIFKEAFYITSNDNIFNEPGVHVWDLWKPLTEKLS